MLWWMGWWCNLVETVKVTSMFCKGTGQLLCGLVDDDGYTCRRLRMSARFQTLQSATADLEDAFVVTFVGNQRRE